jgi:hypothetical protein
MATRDDERRVLIRKGTLVIVVLCLVCVGSTLLVSAWMGSIILLWPESEFLSISDVQFGIGYLKFTVRNDGEHPTTVTGVTVNQTVTRVLPFVIQGHNVTVNEILPGLDSAVNEPIEAGGHVSIIICYEWVSGSTYQIRLTSSRGDHFPQNHFTQSVLAP